MTPTLSPNFDKGLTADWFLSIRDRILRVSHRLAVKLCDHVPGSQACFIRGRIRCHLSNDSAVNIRGNVQFGSGVLIKIGNPDPRKSFPSRGSPIPVRLRDLFIGQAAQSDVKRLAFAISTDAQLRS